VGVVPDGRYRSLEDVRLDVYVPAEQAGVFAGTIVARTSQDPSLLIPESLAAVRAEDPLVPVDGVMPLGEAIRTASAPWRLGAGVLVLFAAVTWLLSLVGLRAMLAYSIGSRTREMAVRKAIGAGSRHVTLQIVRESAPVVVAGLAAGAALSLSATKLLEHLAFSVAATDVSSYLGAPSPSSARLLSGSPGVPRGGPIAWCRPPSCARSDSSPPGLHRPRARCRRSSRGSVR